MAATVMEVHASVDRQSLFLIIVLGLYIHDVAE